MAKPFTQFRAMYSAIHGYHPFNPDCGIFAGGYQGPLYPNPTTLISPNTKFNPLPYQNPLATNYTMKNTGDFYEGLGIGDPGINYRNPGHILGIFDTYLRMSYGLNILKGTRSLSTNSKFGRSVEVGLPLLGAGGVTAEKIWSDVYPLYSEEPDDYIISFVNSNGMILNPRISEPFNFNSSYSSSVLQIDLFKLFGNFHIYSYFGMPEIFQDYFSQLITFAQNNINGQKESFLNDVDFPTLISDIPKHYPFEGRLSFLETADIELNGTSEEFEIFPNRFGSNFKVLDRTTALKSMTGKDVFHKVRENVYEYRSLTELNSVVNIIPVQGYSFTFNCLTTDPDVIRHHTSNVGTPHVVGEPIQERFFIVFSLVDVIINILNLSSRSVTINGSISMEYLGTPLSFTEGPDPLVPFAILSPGPEIQRKVSISTSLTNLFTWDRAWLGLDEFNNKTLKIFSANHEIATSVPVPLDIIDISNTFELQQGNNCIRARILSHSMGFVTSLNGAFDEITTNLTINIPDIDPINYSFVSRGGFSLYPYE